MEKYVGPEGYKKLGTLLDLRVSSLRRGHANLLCIVPILSDDPRRESDSAAWQNIGIVTLNPAGPTRVPRGSHAGPTQAPLSLDSSAAKREIPRAGTRDPRGSYAGPTRVPLSLDPIPSFFLQLQNKKFHARAPHRPHSLINPAPSGF